MADLPVADLLCCLLACLNVFPPLQFEKQFENLDVQSEFVEQAMQNQAVLSTPEEDVNELVQQVADEHGLETGFALPQASTAPAPAQKVAASPENDLTQWLAELRNK